jgi:hypothetical protein
MATPNATPYSPDDSKDTGMWANGDPRDISTNLRADRWVFFILLAITCLRSLSILASPLELGVDEAQYWLWSQTFDFGYFTKPPLTSWIIGLSHAAFGHHQWAVRLPAPWLHLLTALVLWRGAVWLASPAAGRRAALLWITLPAVGLGSFLMSTDTPLLLFWSAGLLAIIGVMGNRIGIERGMLLAGAAFGIAFLAKYAAIYAFPGLVLLIVITRVWHAETRLPLKALIWFGGGFLLLASPNLIWNLSHDFAAVRHLGDNANLARQSYDIGNSIRFIGAQFLTAGPLVFALMLGVFRLRTATATHVLLFAFSAPPLLIITLQAFLSEANANWALTAMPALVLWLAIWPSQVSDLSQRPESTPPHTRCLTRRRLVGMAAGVNALLAAVLVVICWAGSMGPITPESDPLRRLRGWHDLAVDTRAVLTTHDARTVIADRRASAALLHWHFHDSDITVLVHDDDGYPSNHFEANHPWTPTPGRRTVALHAHETPPAIGTVLWNAETALSDTKIAQNRSRRLYLFSGIE